MGPHTKLTSKNIVSLARSSKTIKRKTNILQLPTEILQKILAEVPMQHFRRIRATCTVLKATTDYHLRHRLIRALHLSDAETSVEINTACDSVILKFGKPFLEVPIK